MAQASPHAGPGDVPPGPAPALSMEWVPGGTFRRGADGGRPEDAAADADADAVTVAGLWVDRTPVTNEHFRRFVRETGHVTVAERRGAASAVFTPPATPAARGDPRAWWVPTPAADWRHPRGPQSSLRGCEDHPVVHVAWDDAVAFAAWAGRELPTEAEWECAARGGLDGAPYAWGAEPTPGGRHLANLWQGEFPCRNDCVDGHRDTSPVYAFPPNGHGLRDVVGNVWEWTTSLYGGGRPPTATCSAGAGPPLGAAGRSARHVVKGGSHLCGPHCGHDRPAARLALTFDTTASNLGFRCVVRP